MKRKYCPYFLFTLYLIVCQNIFLVHPFLSTVEFVLQNENSGHSSSDTASLSNLYFPPNSRAWTKRSSFSARIQISISWGIPSYPQVFQCKSNRHRQGKHEGGFGCPGRPWTIVSWVPACSFMLMLNLFNLPSRLNSTDRTSIFSCLNGIVLITWSYQVNDISS